MRVSTSKRRVTLLALVPLLALAACGSDDDTASSGGSDGDFAEYCEKETQIETLPEPDIDFESLSEEELQAEVKRFASEELLPLAEEIGEVAPEEIAEDIEVQIESVRKAAETGDFTAFETEENESAGKATHEFDLENCGWDKVEVVASDYAFAGIDKEIEAGTVSFDLTNEGDEVHELGIFRKKAGVTDEWDALLADEASAEEKTEDVVFIDPTKPGEEEYSVAELEAGEYLAVCFLPVGATPDVFDDVEAGEAEPPEGAPHFTRGMRVEFTVE
jgi:hypothetical protein